MALPFLPGHTVQCIPPANLLTLPSQPGHHAQPQSRFYAHSYMLTPPGLASCSAVPTPPPALPEWPLTEPKSPLYFAATLPPTVLGSCLVNLDSIRSQNPCECAKLNCWEKKNICTNPCLNIKCNTWPPAVLRSFMIYM